MSKKHIVDKKGNTCGDCIHLEVCAAWNIGSLDGASLTNSEFYDMPACSLFLKDDLKFWHKPYNIERKDYIDEQGDNIPFLVCRKDSKYPFVAYYNGTDWIDKKGNVIKDIFQFRALPNMPNLSRCTLVLDGKTCIWKAEFTN